MNILKQVVLGGLAAVLVLAAVPAPAAEMPDGVEAVIKQAQQEGSSAKEARRVARYAYKNGGETEALQAMDTYRKMLKEGIEDREAGKAVMKTTRARVRAGETGGKDGLQVRTRNEAGDGEGSGVQVRKEAGSGDGTGDQVRIRTRAENGGKDAISDKDAEKQVNKQLAEKKQQRLRDRKKAQEREDEAKMEERRNQFRHRGEAGSGSGDSGKKGNR
jgi:hypothetical protein